MANIDTSKIENFETLSAEDKLKAVLAMEIPEAVDLSKYVSKDVFDKKASEAAELSKKLNGKLSDDEKAQAERERIDKENADKYAELEKKFNDLTKKTQIAEYKAKFLAQGYDEKLAQETAEALEAGNTEKVFANSETFKAELEKKIKADLMKKTPRPDGGAGDGGEHDAAVEKAKELAKAKFGDGKAYNDIMSHYKK